MVRHMILVLVLSLPYTCYVWAGGTFFPVVLLCQYFVLAGNRFWFYILLKYLEYHTVVVLCQFFWFWQEIVLVLLTYLVYNTVVRLCQFFCCGRKANLVQIFLLNPNFLLVHRNKISVTVYLFLVLYGSTVGRRGTNQLSLLERYLDVLVKHTTEIPPPTALVEVLPQLPQQKAYR